MRCYVGDEKEYRHLRNTMVFDSNIVKKESGPTSRRFKIRFTWHHAVAPLIVPLHTNGRINNDSQHDIEDFTVIAE